MGLKLYISFLISTLVIIIIEISLLSSIYVPSYLVFIDIFMSISSLIIVSFKEKLTHYLFILNIVLLSSLGPWLPANDAALLVLTILLLIIIYLTINDKLGLGILGIMAAIIYMSLVFIFLLMQSSLSNMLSLVKLLGINKALFSLVFSWYLALFIVFIIIYFIIKYLSSKASFY